MRVNVYSQEQMACAFEKIAQMYRTAPPETGLD